MNLFQVLLFILVFLFGYLFAHYDVFPTLILFLTDFNVWYEIPHLVSEIC